MARREPVEGRAYRAGAYFFPGTRVLTIVSSPMGRCRWYGMAPLSVPGRGRSDAKNELHTFENPGAYERWHPQIYSILRNTFVVYFGSRDSYPSYFRYVRGDAFAIFEDRRCSLPPPRDTSTNSKAIPQKPSKKKRQPLRKRQLKKLLQKLPLQLPEALHKVILRLLQK